jgi:hypothetical protein
MYRKDTQAPLPKFRQPASHLPGRHSGALTGLGLGCAFVQGQQGGRAPAI